MKVGDDRDRWYQETNMLCKPLFELTQQMPEHACKVFQDKLQNIQKLFTKHAQQGTVHSTVCV